MAKSAWRSLCISERNVIGCINRQLSDFAATYADGLPDLSGARTLLIGSDYSGDSANAPYLVYSILMASIDSWFQWESTRLLIRKKFLADARRVSFKRLGDGQRRRALPHLLKAADSLSGLSLSLAVNKRCQSFFGTQPPLDLSNERFSGFTKWKPHVLDRAFLLAHVIGALIGGLSSPGQNVLWFTDEDSIAANDERVCELTNLFSWVSNLYLTFDLGHLRCGTSKCDDGSMQIEDFLALPDLIAGALSEQLTMKRGDPSELSHVFWMSRPEYSDKTSEIIWWFSCKEHPLKRLVFVIDPTDHGDSHRVSFWHFFDQRP